MFAATASGMLVYEALKSALLPRLTLWESHAVTIVVSAVLAALVARHALAQQARMQRRAAGAETARARLAARQAALAERAETLARVQATLLESEAQFRAVAEAATDAIISVDREDRVVFWNAAAERIFERPAAAMLGAQLSVIVPPEHREAHEAGLARVGTGGTTRLVGTTVEVEAVRASGERFPIELSLSAWHARGGPVFTAIVRDISDRKRAEQALRESEQRFRLLVEQSPVAIAVHRDERLLFANAAATTLLGVPTAASVVGRRIADFVHPDDWRPVGRRLAGSALGTAGAQAVPYRLLRLDGAPCDVEAVSVRVHYEGRPALQTVFHDVTARKQLEAQLAHQAFHDALTGLANRALFHDRVGHALARTARSGVGGTVAVLLLDLDGFKMVNDSLGHGAGDRLLAVVADRLRSATRGYDTVARLGGDEFAVLLEELAAPDHALPVVARVTAVLRQPILLDGREVDVTGSVGLAHAAPGDEVETLLRNADVAMYQAKAAGKARHVVFEPAMYEAVVARLELEQELKRAADAPAAHGFHVVYQPLVDLATGAPTGLEALLRWEHSARGAISPAVFIPIAEEAGAIGPLGRWVLETACTQLAEWDAISANDVAVPMVGAGAMRACTVSVNVSGRQLDDPAFVATVADILARTQVQPDRVTLEITESVVMQRADQALAALHALKALGVRLAIDDFGTGYSSLSYLRQFPVDVLKIDRAFVEGLTAGGSDVALTRTIIALGETLQLRTVAEGIERVGQRNELQALGCAHGQGFLFARPMRAADVAAWWATTRSAGASTDRCDASGAGVMGRQTPAVPHAPMMTSPPIGTPSGSCRERV